MQQAGLATAVRADQAGQLTGPKIKVGALDPPWKLDRAGNHQRAHRLRLQRICATSHRKKGAPSRAVMTPSGSERPIGALRVSRSAAVSRSAPINAAGMIARPGWPRPILRANTGATRPMKPTAPHTATQAPTPSALRQTTQSRSRAIL